MNKNLPPFGTILGAPFGVPAYSNNGFKYNPLDQTEHWNRFPKEVTGLARDVQTGFKQEFLQSRYQCVEYARRFQVMHQKVAFGETPCAYNMWDIDTVEDLTKEEGKFSFVNFPQGSKEPPQPCDLVIWHKSAEQRFGHVAVIVHVNLEEMYYDIGEQNYEEEGWECPEYSRRLLLAYENGYHLTNQRYHTKEELWDHKEVMYGWKRVIK